MPQFKSLPRLPGLKHLPSIKHRTLVPKTVRDTGFVLRLEDEHVQEVFARLKRNPRDYKLAKRVAKKMEMYPNGTIPELIAMDWLEGKNIPPIYLAQIRGGHARKGGVEADLLFQYGGYGIVWLCQGEYWHSRPEVQASDPIDRLRFVDATYHGIKVDKVVSVWERDIYFKRPHVFDMGLLGIGLRD